MNRNRNCEFSKKRRITREELFEWIYRKRNAAIFLWQGCREKWGTKWRERRVTTEFMATNRIRVCNIEQRMGNHSLGKTERNWPTLVTTATTASRGNDRGIRLTILQHGPLVLWISNRPANRHGNAVRPTIAPCHRQEPMAIPTELDANGLVAPTIFTLWITVFRILPNSFFPRDVESRFTIRDNVDEEEYNHVYWNRWESIRRIDDS